MSYDIYLFRLDPGTDRCAALESLFPEELDGVDPMPAPADPLKEERKRHLADILMEINPDLEAFVPDYGEIVRALGITEEDARSRFRGLELNGPEEGNGIQITLNDDSVAITIPFWHTGDEAQAVFREIWSYLTAIEREAGFIAFDPQLDRVLDLEQDSNAALSAYLGVSNRLPEIVAPLVDDDGDQGSDQLTLW